MNGKREIKDESGAHYDLIVIGAGQGGGPLAGAFARAGQRVALALVPEVDPQCSSSLG